MPSTQLDIATVVGGTLINVAAEAGLCKSRGEVRRLIQDGGLYLNNRRVVGIDACVSETDVIDGAMLVLRSGKKRYHIVRVG